MALKKPDGPDIEWTNSPSAWFRNTQKFSPEQIDAMRKNIVAGIERQWEEKQALKRKFQSALGVIKTGLPEKLRAPRPATFSPKTGA